jgi:hypothetical protein
MAAIGVGILLFIAVTALMRVSLKGVAKLFNAIRHRKINKQIRENAKTQQEYGTGMPQTDAPNVTQQTVAPNITRQTGKSAQASDSGITRQEYGTGVPQTDAPNITQQTDAPDITQQSDAPDITQQSDAPDITQQTGEHASAADITPEAYAPVTEGGEAK